MRPAQIRAGPSLTSAHQACEIESDLPVMLRIAKMRKMPILRGVVFDLDGTLVSQEIDFEAIRRDLGVPQGTPLLEALEQMTGETRARAWGILEEHETRAAACAEPFPGVREVLDWLARQGLLQGLLSRNSRRSVDAVLQRCSFLLDPTISRDDAPYKPSPGGLIQICAKWNFEPSEVLMVGDYIYDIQAGVNAGCRTALITHGRDWEFASLADICIPSLANLPEAMTKWDEEAD